MNLSVRIGRCGTVRCEPAWQWDVPPKGMRDFDLWYVWSGVGTMQHAGGVDPIDRGSLFLLRPRHEYHGRHDRRRRLGVCFVHFDFVDAAGRVVFPDDSRLPPLRSQVRDPGVYETLMRRIVSLHQSTLPADRLAAQRLLESVLLTMASDRLESRGVDDERTRRIDEIARWVREHPGERVTVEELAERAAYGVNYFTRLFTQRIGKTPVAFLIECRIDRAKELLSTSRLSIKQIASALGYRDLFYFSRQFKRVTGRPPAQWRERFLSGRPE